MIELSGLYVITEPIINSTHRLTSQQQIHFLDKVEAAISGGANVLQFRDKSTNELLRRKLANSLLELCRQYGVIFLINDDVRLASIVAADGVHLGKDDMSPIKARDVLGARAIIGVSCYNRLELARQAQSQGADYAAFGRFFPSSTKPDAVQASLELISAAKSRVQIPIVAIGGITANNTSRLITAGVDMVAVAGGIFNRSDAKRAAQAIAGQFHNTIPLT